MGTYYEHEPQLIKDDEIYEIDSVLDRRTRREGKKITKEIKVNWKVYKQKNSKLDTRILLGLEKSVQLKKF